MQLAPSNMRLGKWSMLTLSSVFHTIVDMETEEIVICVEDRGARIVL